MFFKSRFARFEEKRLKENSIRRNELFNLLERSDLFDYIVERNLNACELITRKDNKFYAFGYANERDLDWSRRKIQKMINLRNMTEGDSEISEQLKQAENLEKSVNYAIENDIPLYSCGSLRINDELIKFPFK